MKLCFFAICFRSFDHFLLAQHRSIVKSHPFNAASLYQESQYLSVKTGIKRESCDEKHIIKSSKRQAVQYTVGARGRECEILHQPDNYCYKSEDAAVQVSTEFGVSNVDIIDKVKVLIVCCDHL